MKTSLINPLLLPVSVFIALMSNTVVWADMALALDPDRLCVIDGGKGGKSLTIIAGPDLGSSSDSLDTANEFPEQVTCPSGTGMCSKWNYRYIWNKMNPSHVYADMSADLALISAESISNSSPGELYSSSLGPNNKDTRWIRWTSSDNTYIASFITPTATPRIASAGGKAGKFEGFCDILGAGVPGEQKPAQDTLVAEKLIRTADGDEMCTIVDPVTQCETGVYCGTLDVLPNIAIADLINANNLAVVEVSVPGQACPTFVTNDGLPDTRYYCSGGRCYYFN